MLTAFRLMLVFVLFDPLRKILGHLFVGVGRPGQVIPSLIVRLLVLIVGLFLFGPWLGIAGVALAVDIMAVVGITMLLWGAKSHVDYSLTQLFLVPTFALVIGISLALGVVMVGHIPAIDWITGLIKFMIFTVSYGVILLVIERHQIIQMISSTKRRIYPLNN